MQEDSKQSKAAKSIEQFFTDYELRFLREGHTWPVDEYGPCPPRPDWWTEEDEKGWHKQSEAITDMLTRSKQHSEETANAQKICG